MTTPVSPNTNRYRLKAKLGSGAMATVYRAEDTAVLRDVAVKVLHPQFNNNPTIRQRFLREARTIAQIDHPAIVPIYDIGQTDKHLYIVMRLMEGGSLATRVAKAPLSSTEIQAVIARICSALDAAHQNGVVHRDIKPENILFDQYDQAYLADFGVVKLAESTATMTGDGIIGTPAYMSPEQVSSKTTLDGRSDFYSLGVVLFELLAGDIPYHADTAMQTAMQHVLEPIPKLTSFNARISRSWQKIIDKAMAKDRDKRYQTGTEFAAAVAKVAPRNAVRPSGNDETPHRFQWSNSVYRWGAIGVVAVLVLLGLMGALLNRQANNRIAAAEATAVSAQLAITATAHIEQANATATAQANQTITAAQAAAATEAAVRAQADEAVQATQIAIFAVTATAQAQAQAQAAQTAAAEALCNSANGYQVELISGPELIPSPPVSVLRNAPNPPEFSASWQLTNSGSCDWHNVRVRSITTSQFAIHETLGNTQADTVAVNETITLIIHFDSPEEAAESQEDSWEIVLSVNGLELRLAEQLQISEEKWVTIIVPTAVPPTPTPTPPPTQAPAPTAPPDNGGGNNDSGGSTDPPSDRGGYPPPAPSLLPAVDKYQSYGISDNERLVGATQSGLALATPCASSPGCFALA